MVDRAQIFGEVKRFAHQVRALVEFAESIKDLAELDTLEVEARDRTAKLNAQADALKQEIGALATDADARRRDADSYVASQQQAAQDAIAQAQAKSGEIIAAAEHKRDETRAASTATLSDLGSRTQAAQRRLDDITSEIANKSATRDQIAAEIDALRAKIGA